MPEHLIRLRGGWSVHDPDQLQNPARSLTLPARLGPGFPRRARLERKFGRPRHDPSGEIISLLLEGVPGLIRVVLNGDEHEPPSTGDRLELTNLSLGPRNVLMLEVELDDSGDLDHPWGAVALVISPRAQAVDPTLA